MKKFTRNGKEYWGGTNRKLGLLIYDPSTQKDVASDKVRLFKVNDKKAGTFKKDIVKLKITECTIEELIALKSAINEYSELKKTQRVTHCYQCKSHLDSVDFSICNICNWIKCSCGACGCGYGG